MAERQQARLRTSQDLACPDDPKEGKKRGRDQASTAAAAAVTAAEKQRAAFDVALVQIAIMDGVCAYRRGGWETSRSKVFGKKEFARQKGSKSSKSVRGVRERPLTQAWVYCRWGRSRGFKKGEVGNGGHKWDHGGRVEGRVRGVYGC